MEKTSDSRLRTLLLSRRCFLVDYDGLLVDSERLHFRTWSEVLNREGRKRCKEVYAGGRERNTYQIVRQWLRPPSATLRDVSRIRATLFRTMVSERQLKVMPHATNVLRRLHSTGIVIVVSNSPAADVRRGLRACGLHQYVTHAICWTKGKRAKPAPDLYREAVRQAQLARRQCLAFEDSISGLTAAMRAGVEVVGVSKSALVQSFCREKGLFYAEGLWGVLRCLPQPE